MKRALGVVLVAGVMTLSGLSQEARPPAANAAADAIQDVVFLGGPTPLLIRFHVQIDGKPFRAAWDEYLDRVFKHLDKDGDGRLNADEIQRLPPPSVLFAANRSGAPHGERIAQLVKAAPERTFNREQVVKYFFGSPSGLPFQIHGVGNAAWPVQYTIDFIAAEVRLWDASGRNVDTSNDALFRILDADQNGKLSAKELAAGPARLAQHDTDDDEIIGQEELVRRAPAGDYLFVEELLVQERRLGGERAWALAVNPADRPDVLGQRLLERYRPPGHDPKNPPQKLKRQDIQLDPGEFTRLDRDKDGLLDKEELRRFGERPPDLEFRLLVGRHPKTGVLEPLSPKSPPVDRVGQAGQHSWVLQRGGLRLLLGLEPANLKSSQPRAGLLANLKNTFKNLDRDNNGYLDRKEARGSPLLNDLFAVMDKDGDGQLFDNEMVEFLSPWAELRDQGDEICVSLSSSEESKGLFDLLDSNGDGRLSVRELRALPRLLERHDHTKDRALEKDEFPRTFSLVLRHGPASGGAYTHYGRTIRAVAFSPDGRLLTSQPSADEPKAGPVWFRRMDRNRDGDVSRREFLGSADEFRRIDADADGLISRDEAERFDAQTRKR